MSTSLPLLACLASTLYMTGAIAVVHWVHYPLFERVEASAFRRYHEQHVRLITPVVALPMLVELLSSGWLTIWPPPGSGRWLAGSSLIAAMVTWAVTASLSVPLHGRLAEGFDPTSHRALVRTNAIRAAAWFAHSGIVLGMTALALR